MKFTGKEENFSVQNNEQESGCLDSSLIFASQDCKVCKLCTLRLIYLMAFFTCRENYFHQIH